MCLKIFLCSFFGGMVAFSVGYFTIPPIFLFNPCDLDMQITTVLKKGLNVATCVQRYHVQYNRYRLLL